VLTLTEAEVEPAPEAYWDNSYKIGPPFLARPWLEKNWERCVADPGELDIWAYEPYRNMDERCGVYFLWRPDGGLAYIGRTQDADARLRAHWKLRRIPFDGYSFMPLRLELCAPVEIAHIHALRPPYNAKYEAGEFSGHSAMVERVASVWRRLLREVEPC
jgi:hypothetical protein